MSKVYEEVTIKGKTFNIDRHLKSNLDMLVKSVEKNWDMVGLIDGREGTAKSTLTQMMAYYVTKGNFSHKNIVFTAEQFSDAVDKAKPKTAIVFDEMVMAGLSGDALSSMQKTLIKKFTLIRKKQLYIFLVIPYFFMLSKYFAIARSRFLVHCYSPDGINRGYFKFYNETKKKYVFVKHNKFWAYPKDTKTFNFYGHFQDYSGMFVNKEEYEKKKDEATANIGKDDDIKKAVPTKGQAKTILNINYSAILDRQSSEYRNIQKYKERLRTYYADKLNF